MHCLSMACSLLVDKAVFMVGSYGPRPEEYEFMTPIEEAPKGLVARGNYCNKSLFTDDDKHNHLTWEWNLAIKKEWTEWILPSFLFFLLLLLVLIPNVSVAGTCMPCFFHITQPFYCQKKFSQYRLLERFCLSSCYLENNLTKINRDKAFLWLHRINSWSAFGQKIHSHQLKPIAIMAHQLTERELALEFLFPSALYETFCQRIVSCLKLVPRIAFGVALSSNIGYSSWPGL